MLKIWLIEQHENRGWDTFHRAVVIAADEEAARQMHPSGRTMKPDDYDPDWAPAERVSIEYIGTADQADAPRVVCADFNAG